ncbi:MAG: von Willebrand factor type A domain-containing protein, partial [Planctomycetes bacterium]|nr:von Willebrand factor type A domain-containing protein [Planctomycetota bacterium]
MHDQTTPSPADANGDLGYLLTAYADGQLALAGMAWVEEQLDRRPDLRARLKEIRAVQAALRAEFARFPAPAELGDFARGQVLAAALRGRPAPRRRWTLAALLLVGVSAAVMAVMVTMGRPRLIEQLGAQATAVSMPVPAPAYDYQSNLAQQQDSEAPQPLGAVAKLEEAEVRGREEAVEDRVDKDMSINGMLIDRSGAPARLKRVPSEDGRVQQEQNLQISEMLQALSEVGVDARTLHRQEDLAKKQGLVGTRSFARGQTQRPGETPAPVTAADRLATVQPQAPAAKPAPGAGGGGMRLAGATAAPMAPAAPAAPAPELAIEESRQEAAAADVPVTLAGRFSPVGGAQPQTGKEDERGGEDMARAARSELNALAAQSQPESRKGRYDLAFGAAPPALPQAPPSGTANGIGGQWKQTADIPPSPFSGATGRSGGKLSATPASTMTTIEGAVTAQDKPRAGDETLKALSNANAEKSHVAEVKRAVAFQLNSKLAEVEEEFDAAKRKMVDAKMKPTAGGKAASSTTPAQGGVAYQEHRLLSESSATDSLPGLKAVDPVMTYADPVTDAQREEELAKRSKEGDGTAARLSIVKERYPRVFNDVTDQHQSATLRGGTVDGTMLVDTAGAVGPSATPSQSLATGNAQRAPRDRVAALLATTSLNATAPLATMLRIAAGPDGALAASPALDEVLARPAHLETHDQPSGQALLQLARGAGLQARVLGGVLTLDAARGQLDPTDTQGLDRASFTKAFGTVPMVATADDARSTFALDANTASFERARSQLRGGQLPDPASIQAEHFINAMPMDYPAARGPEAFALYAEAAPSPFARGPADAAVRAPWA